MDRFINTKSTVAKETDSRGESSSARFTSSREQCSRQKGKAEGRDHPFRGFRALFYWPRFQTK